MGSRLLTPDDVAEALQVSPQWVRDHATDLGGRKLGKLWRFPPGVVQQLLAPPDRIPALCRSTDAEPGGASDGGTRGSSGRNAASPVRPMPKNGLTGSEGSFAMTFQQPAR